MSGPQRIIIPPEAFNACYLPHIRAQQFWQIYFGGAGSGKSVFLAGRAVRAQYPDRAAGGAHAAPQLLQ